MSITSDELNFLVYRYLQESGQVATSAESQPLRRLAAPPYFWIPLLHASFSDAASCVLRDTLLCSAAFLWIAPRICDSGALVPQVRALRFYVCIREPDWAV